MDKEEFIKRSFQAAANGYMYSFEEMMEQRASQPYISRLAKTCYGKSLKLLLAKTITLQEGSYELLAAGGQQIVYATDTKIAKIISHSVSWEEEKAEDHAEWYQRNYDHAQPHVAEHIVQTDFDVRRLRGGLFAAIALQPRIRADREFVDVRDMVTYRDDEAYMDQLRALFDALTNLYNNTGLQLDLNGPKNIFLEEAETGARIRLVDTIVVSPEIQAVMDHSRGISTGQTIVEKMNLIESVVFDRPVAV